MNSKELFSFAIGLNKPWIIREIELRKTEESVHGE